MHFEIQETKTPESVAVLIYNSNSVLMTRLIVPDFFETLTSLEQHEYLRHNHFNIIKRIR